MIEVILIFSGLHSLVFFAAAWYWQQIEDLKSTSSSGLKFSILIPVRNEAGHIGELLAAISRQTYPRDLFEVIIINDHSVDRTIEEVYSSQPDFELRVIHLPDHIQGKKMALTLGVNEARNPFIITTDGDCHPGSGWVEAYASCYEKHDYRMIAGPVRMVGNSFFERLQQLEFATLIGFGAAALRSGNPTMCNGANLSYRKSIFLEVDGYSGNESIPSGDDEFLLQKIFRKYPGQVGFLKNQHGIVVTQAKHSLASFINQRIRWTGKWKYHQSWFVKALAVIIFLDYFTLILGLAGVVVGMIPAPVFGFVLGARYVAEVALAWPVSRFLHIKPFLLPSVVIQIIYPLCVSFLGFASIFGHYSWKGRKY